VWDVLSGLLGRDARSLAALSLQAPASAGMLRAMEPMFREANFVAEDRLLERSAAAELNEPDEVDRLFGIAPPG